MQRISDAGIAAIDLREKMQEDGLNVTDMFYRTDHHWTTASGLWAAQKIAEGLNAYCGYSIDLNLYDPQNYTFKTWKNCWLGEQGRKVAATYIGLDDYTEIKPNFPTSYTFITADSYAQVTQPFLSLGVAELYSLMLRSYGNSFDLRQYIIENGFDTVVICYAQFMIGARDNQNSANYRMFTLR